MLARLHSFLGVALCGYLLVHLYDNWPAIHGREPWVDRAHHGLARGVALALVLAPLLVHGAAGALRFVRESRSARAGTAEARGLGFMQALSALLVLGFVVYHVVSLGTVELGPHADERAVYAYMWRNLGRPTELAIYVVGIAAVCFHAGFGLSRVVLGFGILNGPRALVRARVLAGVFGFVVFGLFLQVLGHFALGARPFG